jgi:hypothetical protein
VFLCHKREQRIWIGAESGQQGRMRFGNSPVQDNARGVQAGCNPQTGKTARCSRTQPGRAFRGTQKVPCSSNRSLQNHYTLRSFGNLQSPPHPIECPQLKEKQNWRRERDSKSLCSLMRWKLLIPKDATLATVARIAELRYTAGTQGGFPNAPLRPSTGPSSVPKRFQSSRSSIASSPLQGLFPTNSTAGYIAGPDRGRYRSLAKAETPE